MDATLIQKEEQRIREELALAHYDTGPAGILKAVSRHHCIAVMSERARSFRRRFNPAEWVLDVGSGSGYYWRGSCGAKLILIDFTINNLKAAKTLLKDEKNIILIQADAAHLPFKSGLISGAWSVQATQHFPEAVMASFLSELKRVLGDSFLIQIYNLNSAGLYRILCRLLRKKLQRRDEAENNLAFRRYTAFELRRSFRSLLPAGRHKIGFSELFFHPDLHFCPQTAGIIFLERLFSRWSRLAGLFARQIQIEILSQPD
jgi:ubiquinone/menaquinone biosynthesis C-methylase UbiE